MIAGSGFKYGLGALDLRSQTQVLITVSGGEGLSACPVEVG